jgi:hypothetical protein
VGGELARAGALSAIRLGEIAGPISHPDVVLPNNPQLAFWNALANGYAFIEVTREAVFYEPRGFAVDRPVEGAQAEILGRLRVAEGVANVTAVHDP